MRHSLLMTIALATAVATIGCGRDAPPPQPSSDASTLVHATKSRASEPSKAAADLDTVDSPPASDEDPDRSPPDASDDPAADAPPPKDAPPRERIAILTPGGPLLVDVSLTIDGQSHAEAFAARIQKVLEAGDAHGDGRSTWRELAENNEFLSAQRANRPNDARRRAALWLRRFDFNRDKEIQREEAAAWLGRDAGRSAAAFALRSQRSYRAMPIFSSRVWQLLDVDNDSQLNDAEIASAPDQLLTLDANDDRIITPAELAPLREQLQDMNRSTPYQRGDTRHAALHLEPQTNLERLEYRLSDLYAPRQNLGPASFPELPRLFDQLDTNGDGSLDRGELAGILTLEAHLHLAVSFETITLEDRGEARLQLCDHAPELVVDTESPHRFVLALGNTRIIVSAHDLTSPQPADRPAEASGIRTMVHDECDALLEFLDQNSDGRLGEREITASPRNIYQLDVNRDRKVTNSELPTAMIVAFLRSEAPNEQSFYVPELRATLPPIGDSPSWFLQADFNNDGEISRREFLGTVEQFAHLDADDDGYITAAEAAQAMATSSGSD